MEKIVERGTSNELTIRILTVAEALFKEHGIHNISMHQIAKKAGIGQGTLYRRYSNKGEICEQLIKENFVQLKDDINCYLEQTVDHLRKKIEYIMIKWIQFIEKKNELVCAIQSTFALKKPACIYQTPIYLFMYQTFSSLLKNGIEQGNIKESIDPVFTAHVWIESMSPQFLRYLKNEKGYTNKQIVENLFILYVDPVFFSVPLEESDKKRENS